MLKEPTVHLLWQHQESMISIASSRRSSFKRHEIVKVGSGNWTSDQNRPPRLKVGPCILKLHLFRCLASCSISISAVTKMSPDWTIPLLLRANGMPTWSCCEYRLLPTVCKVLPVEDIPILQIARAYWASHHPHPHQKPIADLTICMGSCGSGPGVYNELHGRP